MKMHPKARKRHRSYVAPVRADVYSIEETAEPYRIRFEFLDGSTTMLTLNQSEAQKIVCDLATLIGTRNA